ncbi:MAG: Xaa-Pro peptidase family protein [Candidatus Bathyarchaeota archaeon]|nr:Xaa-Pro peptidase family protein [Candidatus Bathyarchaeota archaeon]MDH5732306.1 Xaa-Pro peptidase family protein [Candidatus Bathyarchaeota archaeon]
MENRIRALKKTFAKEEISCFLVANEINMLYFTDFIGGAMLLAPKADENILFVHGVNYEAAKAEAKNCNVRVLKRKEDLLPKVAEEIKSLKPKQVGFDSLEASLYLKMKNALKDIKLEPKDKMIWELRRIKDETELNKMRKAAWLTDEGVRLAVETIKSGVREYEAAAEIEYAMRRLGSEGVAFDTIVASGVRSAFPHGGCTDQKIRKGDLVVLDVGAKYRNYRSDLTRTFVVGDSSPKQRRIYETVKEAQETAFQSIHEGVRARDADRSARKIIEKDGYDEYFVHSLGHGVGLETHEQPTLGPESKDVLKAQNVVTVEPGIYIVDFGGVRIEDTVLVKKESAERLTKATYDFEIQ